LASTTYGIVVASDANNAINAVAHWTPLHAARAGRAADASEAAERHPGGRADLSPRRAPPPSAQLSHFAHGLMPMDR